jgi:major intracellular serine protease
MKSMNFKEPNDEKLNLAGFLLVSILGLAAGAGIGFGSGFEFGFGFGLEQEFQVQPRHPMKADTSSALRGTWIPSRAAKEKGSPSFGSSLRGLRGPDSIPSAKEFSPKPLRPSKEEIQPQPASPPQPSRDRATPKGQVRVAVIDTGIDHQHPELAAYIEKESAWDFVSGTAGADDAHGHGTHIAGLIVREAKVQNLKLIPLRYYAEGLSGGDALRFSVRAFYRAIALKVDVINYSGGGARPSREELEALRAANAAGILVVAASGNEGSDADQAPFYPASYGLPNLISVTATNAARELLPTSNWGRASVQLATAGEDLLSTLPGGREGKMTGTSQATARATAAAVRLIAELRTQNLDTSPEMVRAALEVSGTREPRLAGRTANARFLDQEQVLLRREAGWQREPSGISLSQWRAVIEKSSAVRRARDVQQDIARSH